MARFLIPVGSVVRLGDESELVIVGYGRISPSEPDVLYDYFGYPYPEGVSAGGGGFGFNDEAVDTILHMGYMSPEQRMQADSIRERMDAFRLAHAGEDT